MSGEYDLIYADPPWRYAQKPPEESQSPDAHYKTLSIREIRALRVPAAKDCILFLWATAPLLPESLSVLDAWGFKFKTCAVWDKQRIGIGWWWFRGQHEILLVGTRGKVHPPPSEHRRSSVFSHPRTGHSKKPDAVRQWIEEAFPDVSRVELFAREEWEGWDVWGDEVESTADVRMPEVLR